MLSTNLNYTAKTDSNLNDKYDKWPGSTFLGWWIMISDLPRYHARWWFQICFFSSLFGEIIHPNWLIFFKGVEITNQHGIWLVIYASAPFKLRLLWYLRVDGWNSNPGDIEEKIGRHLRIMRPSKKTGWWFQIFFYFSPLPGESWGNDPFWLIFFKWVETTNQKMSYHGSLV